MGLWGVIDPRGCFLPAVTIVKTSRRIQSEHKMLCVQQAGDIRKFEQDPLNAMSPFSPAQNVKIETVLTVATSLSPSGRAAAIRAFSQSACLDSPHYHNLC